MSKFPRVCFIGFGEAGQALASGLRESGVEDVAAWDILFPTPAGAALLKAAPRGGVRAAISVADAVSGADLIISAVTASSSLGAAEAAKAHLKPTQFFLDINSVSPARKREVAECMQESVRYVDVAVIAPVLPAHHRTPMLLAGPDAEALAPLLLQMGMRASVVGQEIGMAAAIKMIRSVMVKGMEALTFECFVAASRAGVTWQVMKSLSESFPGVDWAKQVQYNMERMSQHGIRRAAEMREVAKTLSELEVRPLMTQATTEHQQRMGELKLPGCVDAANANAMTDTLKAIDDALRHAEQVRKSA